MTRNRVREAGVPLRLSISAVASAIEEAIGCTPAIELYEMHPLSREIVRSEFRACGRWWTTPTIPPERSPRRNSLSPACKPQALRADCRPAAAAGQARRSKPVPGPVAVVGIRCGRSPDFSFLCGRAFVASEIRMANREQNNHCDCV